ncbi:hypothetical protein [Cytobacillus gottheilii]|uniref:MnxA n=1 Tax=Cytobacillus gottheilii TaxID=859144 RepID=A0ABX8FEM7_9BACI|nr:hypothetical protein [Cytobacillus gottheilii]QVY62466.1 hypothetical protein J1899_05135 [Cytobacillus gottheilii]
MGHLGFLLYGNLVLILFLYLYLNKIRKLIGFQLGMNISMLAGGFGAIATGVILIYQFPLKFVIITMMTAVIGMLIGGLFGALFDYQTLLTGYINGLMMGIMAPMVGAAANTSILFLSFVEAVFLLSLLLVLLSAKNT